MSGKFFHQVEPESPQQHQEEADRLLHGIRAWCATTDESYESPDSDQESSGRLND